ncbi:GNAT family N-acetyltransferase [Notoacmeibacter marinus]|uniref:GNAT family N-acetyltransferase n=1 Tax=Notoacmeibacter marinus TaxID=1876515 RepID=UPI000DF36BBA|nr:GNAT family N-acetyltransferase [Notoacmeibacter marinus]
MSDFVTPSPNIETERLLLRGWRADDAALVAAIYADQQAARFIGGVKSREESWRTFASVVGHWHLRGFGFFVVQIARTGDAIGFCGPWFPEGWPEHEIGYAFLPSAHGKGYATEAVTESLRHAYDRLGWQTAISLIDPLNTASQAVAGRVGAVNSGEPFAVPAGTTVDIWRHLSPDRFRERFHDAA